MRGSFVVGAKPKTGQAKIDPVTARPERAALPAMIGPLLKLMAVPAMARTVRASAADAATRAGFGIAAGLAGAVGLFCFSRSSLTVLERNMDPAEAWAVLGGFYSVAGGILYFAATKWRRG